jgi:hypothetical protein
MSTTQHVTVVGVFATRLQAERAIEELRRAGFADELLGLIASHAGPSGDPAEECGVTKWGAGAATGAVAGGAAAGLVGLAGAAGLIPGVGQVVACGLLCGLLASTATGAAAGGLLGALIGLGIPEDDARALTDQVSSGRALVTVKADSRSEEALEILRRNDGRDMVWRTAVAAAAPTVHGELGAAVAAVACTDTVPRP